jgi:predicted nuclease of predicted toxin-antitoxin system
MQFIADENIDKPIVGKLRNRGFSVLYVEEDMKGVSDEKVIDKAVDEELVLITFDRDF